MRATIRSTESSSTDTAETARDLITNSQDRDEQVFAHGNQIEALKVHDGALEERPILVETGTSAFGC